MTGGLSQPVETQEGFVRGRVRIVLGSQSWATGEHLKVVGERGSFARVETVFDRDCSVNACETSVGPLEIQGWCPVTRLVLDDWSRSALASAEIF